MTIAIDIERAIRAAHEAGRRSGRDEMRAEMERDALRLDVEHADEVRELRDRIAALEDMAAATVRVECIGG